MPEPARPQRRAIDPALIAFETRLALVEHEVKGVVGMLTKVGDKLDAIRDDMTEPQASPLGRALLERSVTNATGIREVKADIVEVKGIQREQIGGIKAIRLLGVVLAVAIALLTVYQFTQGPL